MTIAGQLRWLDVEASDLRYDGQGEHQLAADTDPVFLRLFDQLEVDGSSCASCEQPIGYVILDGADDGRMRGSWRWVTLVWDAGRRIGWAVCEECACALDPMVSRLLVDDRELPRVDAVAVGPSVEVPPQAIPAELVAAGLQVRELVELLNGDEPWPVCVRHVTDRFEALMPDDLAAALLAAVVMLSGPGARP